MRPSVRAFVLSMMAACLLMSCSWRADTHLAEEGVEKFHQQLDAAEYAKVYDAGSKELRDSMARTDFIALLSAVHRKLGQIKSAERQGMAFNAGTSGTHVTLTYHTVFERGGGMEQFIFRMEDDRAVLAGYKIDSNALIINDAPSETI
jgi:Protein of unknown function (DUF4019)